MVAIPSTVVFLARAARLVGAICVFIWLIAAGMTLLGDPNVATRSRQEIIAMLEPTAALYLLPGMILLLAGLMAKAGRLWAAPVILLVGILSLFKLVLLLVKLPGPILHPPLFWELPARILCAALSVPCAFAWEDLAEMNRTRARRTRRLRVADRAEAAEVAPQAYPPPPPPATRIPRRPIRPDDPPGSQTPWS